MYEIFGSEMPLNKIKESEISLIYLMILDDSSIIDHIATTCARNIIKSGVHEVSMSDHYMVYCIRKHNGAVEKGH